jgi:glucose/arabinose dehydrogenase
MSTETMPTLFATASCAFIGTANRWLTACLTALLLGACGEAANLTVAAGTGLRPDLPLPQKSALPTVNIAPAIGWTQGGMPVAAAGLQVQAFARGLDHPRWLYRLPNGDVLVAESNAPAKPDDAQGLRGWVMNLVMKRAGAKTVSANRITLLRDSNGVGVADQRFKFLEGLNSPFGMVLVRDHLYVANSDSVWRFPYQPGDTYIAAAGDKLVDLPAGRINHHWTKNLIASSDGNHLYVTVGSNSNVAERGMAEEEGRAAIWQIDIATGANRVFASGLRNPVGMAWDAGKGDLWTVVNERDELGSDLVPDYLTSVKEGGFYGWPYSYYGKHVDARVQPPRPDLVAKALVPDYALGPHTASLGLASALGNQLPPQFAQGMFVGQHGSWNRRPHSGYKVVFVPFAQGRPTGEMPLDVLDGFLSPDGRAYGRPVGVALDQHGALLVADDVGNVVWRVAGARPALALAWSTTLP